jgi:hypothetical protein
MRDANDGTLLSSVVRYFDETPEALEKLRLVLRGRVPGVSLRLLDYLVTNYSKSTNASFVAPDGERVRLFREYKAQLRGYSKLAFDPFARRCRIVVEFGGGSMETTVAQLNFFRWAISRGVVDYASKHSAEIEEFYSKSRGGKETKKSKILPSQTEESLKSCSDEGSAEKVAQNVLSF